MHAFLRQPPPLLWPLPWSGLPAPESGPQGGSGWKPEGRVPGPEPQTSCHTSAPLSPVAEVLSECRLLAYISQVPTQMSFLFRLINIIHVQTLTQVTRPADVPGREIGNSLPHPGARWLICPTFP